MSPNKKQPPCPPGLKKPTDGILIVNAGSGVPGIRFLAGLAETSPAILLRNRGVDTLMVADFDVERARSAHQRAGHVTKLEIVSPAAFDRNSAVKMRLIEWAPALLKSRGVGRIRVAPDLAFEWAAALKQKRIVVHMDPSNPVPEREIKSADEMNAIRDSVQAAVIAMRRAIALLKQARPDAANGVLKLNARNLHAEDLQDLIHRTLMEQHCICPEVIVAGGPAGANPHEPGRGPLMAGELIVIDIFPRHLGHGYWGDISRTIVRGQASPRMRAMHRAVVAAQAAGLKELRPGAQCRAVHAAVVETLERRRFNLGPEGAWSRRFSANSGHGIGLENHEAPSLGPNSRRLKANQVLTLEPGLYYPGLGGVRVEDCLVVTETGWRSLVPCEKTLEI